MALTVSSGTRLFVTNDEFLTLKNEMIQFKSDQHGKFNALKSQFESLEQSLRNEIETGRNKIDHLEKSIEKTELQNAKLTAKLKETEMKLKKNNKYGIKNTLMTNGLPKTSAVFADNKTSASPYMIQNYNVSLKENNPRRSLFKSPRMLVGSGKTFYNLMIKDHSSQISFHNRRWGGG